jgi:teichuronic acid biosynthesis glycosyltransferase TuaC
LQLRVLTFTSLFPNGADPEQGIFIYQRAAHLAARNGNFVEVVAPIPYFPKWLSWLSVSRWTKAAHAPSVEYIGQLKVHHQRYFLIPKLSMFLHGFLIYVSTRHLIAQLHAEKNFDYIDAHFVYPDGFAAILLARCLRVPVMISARGTDMNVYPNFFLIRRMIRWTLRNADFLVAVSRSLKERMIEQGGADLTVHVIPNGVDTTRFHPVSLEEARRELGIQHIGPLIVSVGSLIESKGHHVLIRAVAQIARSRSDVHLYIFGHGPERDALQRLIESLNIAGQVHLMGKRPNDELHLWFNIATVSCLASTREGWPNVVSESLACGTPVIATNVGGIPEIIDHPELGMIVERTPESFAAAIEQALSKRWDRQAISKRGCARTWDTVAQQIEEVLVTTKASQ